MKLTTKQKLAILRGAKKFLQSDRPIFDKSLCIAIGETEDVVLGRRGPMSSRLQLYGLRRHKSYGRVYWFERDDVGTRKRIAILDKRIKELTKK